MTRMECAREDHRVPHPSAEAGALRVRSTPLLFLHFSILNAPSTHKCLGPRRPRRSCALVTGTALANPRAMSDVDKQLAHVIQQGYVIRRGADPPIWKLFYTWCLTHAQPYVYIDLLRTTNGDKGAKVTIDLFTTTPTGRDGDRFTPEALAEAKHLLARYPRVTGCTSPTPDRIASITIRATGIAVEQADELAQALLALYRRMKETNARTH